MATNSFEKFNAQVYRLSEDDDDPMGSIRRIRELIDKDIRSNDFNLFGTSNVMTPIFRGEPYCYNYKSRLCPRVFRPDVTSKFTETELINEFQKQYPQHASNCQNNVYDWLNIMQHNGTPTRLLDWSSNQLVALYFAVNSDNANSDEASIDKSAEKNDCALYSFYQKTDYLNINYLFCPTTRCIIDHNQKRIPENLEERRNMFISLSKDLLAKEGRLPSDYRLPHENLHYPGLNMCIYKPPLIHDRTKYQQSVFTAHIGKFHCGADSYLPGKNKGLSPPSISHTLFQDVACIRYIIALTKAFCNTQSDSDIIDFSIIRGDDVWYEFIFKIKLSNTSIEIVLNIERAKIDNLSEKYPQLKNMINNIELFMKETPQDTTTNCSAREKMKISYKLSSYKKNISLPKELLDNLDGYLTTLQSMPVYLSTKTFHHHKNNITEYCDYKKKMPSGVIQIRIPEQLKPLIKKDLESDDITKIRLSPEEPYFYSNLVKSRNSYL